MGDIHGQLQDLLHILDQNGLPNGKIKYCFNGDFVDRGEEGVEVLLILCALAVANKDSVVLNRGNHEDPRICTLYGFKEECVLKYDEALFIVVCSVFPALPLFTIVNKKVFIVHGGLFHTEKVSLNDLNKIPRCQSLQELNDEQNKSYLYESSDDLTDSQLCRFQKDLMLCSLWSDPIYESGCYINERGAGVLFGPDLASSFMRKNNLSMVIRSHQVFFIFSIESIC